MIKQFIKSKLPFVVAVVRWLKVHVRPRPARESLSPLEIGYSEAWRFFERHRQSYEILLDAVAPRLRPDSVIVDVGANIGYFSRLLMDRLHFRGEAHLFEPLPHLAQLCERTFGDGRYKVQVHPYGLGEDNCEMILYTAGNGNIGWNTMVKGKANGDMRPVKINIRRFDDLGLPDPDFIKVDVEGAEYLVIKGMLPTLRRAKRLPLILCEIGWGQTHPDFKEMVATFHDLQALGYSITDLSGKSVCVENLTATTDVFMEPRNR